MIHVDLVSNDFGSRRQTCVGRVSSIGELGVKVECDDPNLERVLREPLYDSDSGRTMSPHEDGDAYLEVLSRRWDGTYLLASRAHDEDQCPFAAGNSLPLLAMNKPS